MQKKTGQQLFLIILFLFTLSGCSSFDAKGYVQALLDNTYKGESSSLAHFSDSDAEELDAIYQDAVHKTCSSLLSNIDLSDTLEDSYAAFVKEMMKKADYKVTGSHKNDDDSYTITVASRRLDLTVNDAIQERTASYIEELQKQVNEGDPSITETELKEGTYEIILQCYTDALDSATYEDVKEHTITVSLSGKTYTADEQDLTSLSQELFLIQ